MKLMNKKVSPRSTHPADSDDTRAEGAHSRSKKPSQPGHYKKTISQ